MTPEQLQEQDAPTALDARLADQRAMAREQLTAAWQIHVERVEDQLRVGWREQIERVLDDRFSAVEAGLRAELDQLAEERANQTLTRARSHARREMSEQLNQTSRRLEQAEATEAWVSAVLDGAHCFAPRVLLFSVLGDHLRFEGIRPTPAADAATLDGLEIPFTAAPAFRGVVETADTVISARTSSELSEPIAAALGEAPGRRVCLVPVASGRGSDSRRVAAILCAENEGEPLDVNVLELLCAHAGTTFDCRVLAAQRNSAPQQPAGLIGIASVIPISRVALEAEPESEPISDFEPGPELTPAVVAPTLPAEPPAPPKLDLARLSPEDQELHLRAQRFARVRVAEMRLYQPQAVKDGRQQARLFIALRGEMERSRAQFKHEFLHAAQMPDYFHEEIVRTLANDDPSLLGPEYPGPLV